MIEKKSYKFIAEIDGGNLKFWADNQGFSALEIVTLHEMKKQDILKQLMEPASFVRKATEENGKKVTEIVDNPVHEAYSLLEKITNKSETEIDVAEVMSAIEDAVGYLGEALDK